MAERTFCKIFAFLVAVILLGTEKVRGCVTRSDCDDPLKPWCCTNSLCCTASEYPSGNTDSSSGCTNHFDCEDVSKHFCCSDGHCCALDDTATKVLSLGIGIIVGIVVGVILLIVLCIVGIVCCVRSRNR